MSMRSGDGSGIFASVTRTAVKHDPVVLCTVMSLCGCFDEMKRTERKRFYWDRKRVHFYLSREI